MKRIRAAVSRGVNVVNLVAAYNSGCDRLSTKAGEPERRPAHCERTVRICSAEARARSLLKLRRFRISLRYDPVWRVVVAAEALGSGDGFISARAGAKVSPIAAPKAIMAMVLSSGLSPRAGRSVLSAVVRKSGRPAKAGIRLRQSAPDGRARLWAAPRRTASRPAPAGGAAARRVSGLRAPAKIARKDLDARPQLLCFSSFEPAERRRVRKS